MKNKIYKAPYVSQKDIYKLNDAPKACIACYPWSDSGYRPVAYGQVCYTDIALHVKLACYETNPKAVYNNPNDPVYKDSCLEFFINPILNNNAFIDMELNAKGTMLLGFFNNGKFGLLDTAYQKQFNIVSNIYEDFWSVEFTVPFKFLEEIFTGFIKNEVSRMKINFYKCGDDTASPHYGCWNKVISDKPDFFHNEYFGILCLSK